MEVTVTMSSMLADISTIVTSIFTWVGTVCTTITTTPLLLFTVGFLAVGENEAVPA